MSSLGNLAVSITIKNAYATSPFLGIYKSTVVLSAVSFLGAENWETGSYPLIKDWWNWAMGQGCICPPGC